MDVNYFECPLYNNDSASDSVKSIKERLKPKAITIELNIQKLCDFKFIPILIILINCRIVKNSKNDYSLNRCAMYLGSFSKLNKLEEKYRNNCKPFHVI